MASSTICPQCQSANTSSTSRGGVSSRQAFSNRLCNACGTVWRPAAPRWLAIAIIVAGLVVPFAAITINSAIAQHFSDINDLGFGASSSKSSNTPWQNGFYISVGLGACVYGIRILRGRAGQLHVLEKGSAAPPIIRPGSEIPNSRSLFAPLESQPPRNSGKVVSTAKVVEPAVTPGGDGQCVACQQRIDVGIRLCPHCGSIQPLRLRQ